MTPQVLHVCASFASEDIADAAVQRQAQVAHNQQQKQQQQTALAAMFRHTWNISGAMTYATAHGS